MLGNRGKLCGAVAVLTVFTVGCGGGDDSSSEEDEVTAAIEQIAGSRDAGDCTTYATQAYLEQTTFETGPEAMVACEAQAGTTATVEVEDVAVEGDTATATVATTEGELEGQTVGVSLVNDDDTWKLDSIDDFVVFARDSYRAGLEERMVQDGTQAAAVDCVLANFDEIGDDELERMLISGDPNQLARLAEGCA